MTNPPDERARGGAAAAEAGQEWQTARAPLGAWLRYFLWLGTVGFGGPAALVGYMQRDVVERRRWVLPAEYTEGLALAQLAPGPLATQLAIYLGWIRARVLGATLTGLAFVGPSFIMVVALAALYMRYGGLPWIAGAFYGIGAAVIAIVVRSIVKLGRLTIGRDKLLWGVAGVNAVVTAWTAREMIWLVVASGLLVLAAREVRRAHAATVLAVAPAWVVSRPLVPAWLVTGVHDATSAGVLWTMLRFFTTAGLVVFGSGLAIVPFLYGGVVQQFHWLTERQFLDAVAVAMITPGPVVITVAFIGYLVAGLSGAVLAAAGVFLPVYLVVVLVAPHFRRLVRHAPVRTAVAGITAAATGALAGAALVLARRAVVDVPTGLICLATLLVLFTTKRVPEPLVIVIGGIAGVILKAA